MSANLWSDSTASMQIRADGTYLAGKASGALSSAVTGLSSLTENQTVHMGASLKNAGAGVLKPFVGYKDAAGNLNWVGFPSWQPTDSWQRFEDTCVVPSGMTVCGVGFDASGATGDIEVSNPVFCYGSTGIVMASGSVTVASITDVASTTRWYLLQSSTLAAPAAPTANPPGGSWATTEPTYTEGSTNSLYTCDQTIFSDGTWAYSDVSLSTSYEAAKAAYNKAVAAAAAAAATDQHFWADTDGAHVSSTGDHDTSGFHQLMSSVKNAFMHGTTELMTISENLIELGKNSSTAIIKFCAGNGSIGITSSKQLYLSGTDGAYLARQTDIDNGNYVGIGLVDDSGSAKAIIEAEKYEVAGISLTLEQMATAIQPVVVLYNGGAALRYDTAPGAGTTGTVTLSETAANFKELTIFFHSGATQGEYDPNASTTTPFPDGKYVLLPCFKVATSTVIQALTKTVYISGTSISRAHAGYANFIGDTSGDCNYDNIYITRVTGRR